MHKRSALLSTTLLLAIVWPTLSAAKPFTVVILPDTQKYSAAYPQYFTDQTKWILENREKENIVFVGQVGDVVDSDTEVQWAVATQALYSLDSANDLPWASLPGNHDSGNNFRSFLSYFGPQHFAGRPWYGGAYGASSYLSFTGNGTRFLVLMLQVQAPPNVIGWAQRVLDANPQMPAVVLTHDYLDYGGRTPYGEILWQSLIKTNKQIFAVFCGHMHTEFNQASMNDANEPVFELLADYQEEEHGGEGYLRLYAFNDDANEIRTKTYSPTLQTFQSDEDSAFTIPMDFQARNLVSQSSTLPRSLLWIGGGFLSLSIVFFLRRKKPVDPPNVT